MFCSKCGNENDATAQFCSKCGTLCSDVTINKSFDSKQGVSFLDSIKICFAKWNDPKGRAPRSEFWYFYLFCAIISLAGLLIDSSGMLTNIINLITLIPIVNASARRLHDTNRHGAWFLLCFTIIGIIPLIVWWASKGENKENQYGLPH